jgi:hippurate hydrolase
VQDLMEARIAETVEHVAKAFGARAEVSYVRNYPVTVNTHEQTAFAAAVAREIAGEGAVDVNTAPLMGAEDFSFMLNARPGAMIFVGNGDTAGVHHPAYDFNDAVIPAGCSYWARLVERAMPASA